MLPLIYAHGQFWDTSSGEAPPSPTSSPNGYPTWQTSVVVGGGFGVTQVIWEWVIQKITRPHGDIR